MIFTAVFIVLLIQAAGLCVLLVNFQRAAEGYEDEFGFHRHPKLVPCKVYDAFADRRVLRSLGDAEAPARRLAA